jgi:pteridine reductase
MPLALVTGAGVRVGRAIAVALAEAGYDLILHGNRSREALGEVAAAARERGRAVEAVFTDLAETDGAAFLADAVRISRTSLDAIVNNAGLYEAVPFTQLDRERWHRMLAVNLEAPLFLVQALLPLLEAAPAPAVVNVTDVAVSRPYGGYLHYMISKAGLDMLTRALALELAPHVRVNAVAPGTVAFPAGFDEAKRQRILKRVPLRREGSPDDVARAVVWLLRDAQYVTGQTLTVDGGFGVA